MAFRTCILGIKWCFISKYILMVQMFSCHETDSKTSLEPKNPLRYKQLRWPKQDLQAVGLKFTGTKTKHFYVTCRWTTDGEKSLFLLIFLCNPACALNPLSITLENIILAFLRPAIYTTSLVPHGQIVSISHIGIFFFITKLADSPILS